MSTDQEAQEQAAKEMASDQILAADTAFVVFVIDGAAYAVNDVRKVVVGYEGREVELEPMHRATPDDMYRYSMEVAKDVQISQTSRSVAQQMLDVTMQLQQQMKQDKDQGLHVPGR